MRLHGKVALVTGAGQGIGRTIALRLAREGAALALLDLGLDKTTAVEREITGLGGKAAGFAADVSRREDVIRAVGEIRERLGSVDILVNNAGVIRDGLIEDISEADWDLVLDVNLKGAFLCCQAVIQSMRERQYGKIVSLSSRSWLGNIGQTNYAASKGGIVSLTRTLSLELARYGINVNAVAPGLIDTPMTRGLPEKVREKLLKMQPGGKIGKPEDIAAAVNFLVSDEAGYITGQVIHVDGGKSCGILFL